MPVLRENAPRAKCARVTALTAHPHQPDSQFIRTRETIHAPRHRQKQRFPRPAGPSRRRQGPRWGRQGPREGARAARARRGDRRRSSPSADLPERATVTHASGVPMPGSPTAQNHSARSLIRVIESLTPASAMAMTAHRAATLAMRRGLAAIGLFLLVRHAETAIVRKVRSCQVSVRERTRDGEKRPFKPRGDRPNFSRDDRPPRRDRRRRCPPGGAFFRSEVQ